MIKMYSQNIETVKKKFHREWLLIAVDKFDEATKTPVTGKIIAHSPHRDEIYKKLSSRRKKHNILIEYSEDKLPQGYAAAFMIKVKY